MIKEYHSLSAIISQVESQTVRANLTLLSAEHAAGSSLNAHVDASKETKRYRLYNDDDFYDRLLAADPAIQQRLSKWLSKKAPPVGLIVGFLAADDAVASHTATTNASLDASLQIPKEVVATVATAALHGTVPVPPQAVGDIGVTVQANGTSTVQVDAAPAGRSIFAVQYRMVQRVVRSFRERRPELGSAPQGENTFSGGPAAGSAGAADVVSEQVVLGSGDVRVALLNARAEKSQKYSVADLDEVRFVFEGEDVSEDDDDEDDGDNDG